METYPSGQLPMKAWAEDDRPREKMVLKGRHQLTDAELMAILLGSGNRAESAFGLAQRILLSVDNDLNELGKRSLHDLMQFKGIGQAKALTIAAALELGRRRHLTEVRHRPQVRASRDAFQLLSGILEDLPHEEFWVLLLNRANRVIGREQISSGGMAGTVVDSKIVFRKALECKASSLILSHNHPSGQLQPSQADIELTRKLKEGGALLDIGILDHLIVGERNYYSFADEGML
ncbi:MAG: DNA repair protein RadC [Saprospirales bacterium]|jgi:DNA repair protein RadC|nr:DNA repair protein RadC [Saprospirales bacterium]MBK7335719.1 DNA repair protein RadC [Saprospirales bacterium]